ncbi:MAG: hypothetical protein HGB20_01615 [Chlorobiaceae bacterium]|nr:hypothetical protein [Chlorobiaceae bacterium]
MSVLGLSYATYVALTAGVLVFVNPAEEKTAGENLPIHKNEWLITAGSNSKSGSDGPGKDVLISVDYRPDSYLFWKFKPLYAFGFAPDGAVYTSFGIRKDYRIGPVQITPFFGPALYQRDIGSRWEAKELLQFRTGFDVMVPVTGEIKIGGGFYHISNGQNNDYSADIDVTHATVAFSF